MADIRGLIIPRSYNEYVNKSQPADIKNAVKLGTDSALSTSSEQPVQNKVLTALIPNDTTATNQLADKAFVNSTVATNTATFRGTFESVAALEAYAGEKTNNDYAYIIVYTTGGNVDSYKRYKYNGTAWVYEYTLNNSSFTADQWAAINSGATAQIIQDARGLVSVDLTKAEYDALTDAQRNNGTYYNVTDDSPPPYQLYFNIMYPVGSVYEQLPPTLDADGVSRTPLDPNTLFNNGNVSSTWKKLDYGGAFLRTSGGNASVFGTGKQGEQLPNVRGDLLKDSNVQWQVDNYKGSGAFEAVDANKNGKVINNTSTYKQAYITFSASDGQTDANGDYIDTGSTYVDGGEVRPTNLTIIKWIRTA